MSTDRHPSPRPMGFVSAISDTDVKDPNEKGHNPLHHVAHYLKNAVTLESKSDERRRESVIADHAHVNDHGGRQAEAEFWDKHGKGSAHGERSGDGHDHGHGHVTAVNEPVGHVTARNEKAGGGSVTGTLF